MKLKPHQRIVVDRRGERVTRRAYSRKGKLAAQGLV